MCLAKITKRLDGTDKTIRRGYKIVLVTRDGSGKRRFELPYYDVPDELPKFGKWYTADEASIFANTGEYYKSGFHIFPTAAAAKKSHMWRWGVASSKDYHRCVVEVEYKFPTYKGLEEAGGIGKTIKVVVAKKMRFTKNFVAATVPASKSIFPIGGKKDVPIPS